MPKRSRKPRQGDANQRAADVVRIATEEELTSHIGTHREPPPEKNPAAVALGRLGGKRGGAARADALTPERRKEIAQKAAAARWAKKATE